MRDITFYEKKLEQAREELCRLIQNAMDAPIEKNEAILKQGRKIDALTAWLQKEKQLNNL